jgi:hypothetical protein
MKVEIDGTMWHLVIDRASQYTIESPSGNQVLAYKARVVEVVE